MMMIISDRYITILSIIMVVMVIMVIIHDKNMCTCTSTIYIYYIHIQDGPILKMKTVARVKLNK